LLKQATTKKKSTQLLESVIEDKMQNLGEVEINTLNKGLQ
jgi:hypothetical protein